MKLSITYHFHVVRKVNDLFDARSWKIKRCKSINFLKTIICKTTIQHQVYTDHRATIPSMQKLYIYCAQINLFLDQESPSHHFTGPMKVFKRHSVASNLISFKVKRLRIFMVLRLRHIYIFSSVRIESSKPFNILCAINTVFFIVGTTARRFVNPKFPYNYSSAISSKVEKNFI